MATIANLKVNIGGDADQLISELKRSERSVSSMEKASKKAAKAIQFAFGVVATGAIGNLARTSIDAADQMGKLAARLGSTSEALSELAFVADRGGVSFNTLQMGLQRATRRIAEAANGTGEAVKALKELNLSAVELNQLAPEKQFEVIADAISRLGSDSDRVRLAMKLFDSEGVALIQTMQGGAAEIRSLRQEARNLGATISTETAQSAAEFNDRLTILQFKMNGLVTNAAIPAAEALTDLADVFITAKEKSDDLDKQFDGIKAAIKGVATVGIASTGIIAALSESFVGLSLAAKELAEGDLSGAMTELEEATRRTNEQLDLADERIKKLWKTTEQAKASSNATGGVGLPTTTVVDDKEQERAREALQRKIELIDESFMDEQAIMTKRYNEKFNIISSFEATEQTILQERYSERLKIIEDALMAGEIKHYEAAERELALQKEVKRESEKIEAQSNKRKLMLGKQYGLALLSDAAKYSRAAFNINKIAAIADGAIKAKEAVLGAYAFGNKIGGPPLGAAFAAAAGVVAFGQLKAIADSQFNGDSGGSSISAASTPAATGETPIENAANDEPQQKTVFLNIEGIDDEAFLSKNQVRAIVDQINEERDANVRIVI